VTYEKLLDIFWSAHNPSSRSYGQYRAAVFYHNEEQEKAAKKSKDALGRQGITTTIEPVTTFTCAEDYHQKYKFQHYSNIVDALKLSSYDDLINSPVAAKLNGYLGGYGSEKMEDLKQEFKLMKIPESIAARVITIMANSSSSSDFCSKR